ncbi:MAG TPA: ParB/RepB/Spo0J family partition protein [Armatimonadota bacterium]|nr:ParB/RepB/Spo0J family partition protein [Armatimonadota bacterium]
MPRKGLGKGLADLISTDSLKLGAALVELRPNEIEPNPFQPRTSMADAQLDELTRSIERHGVVQPLVVRPVGNGNYQLVTGERRWRASQRAGLATVPCLVRETNDNEALQIALVENLQREDLNAIDAGRGYKQLMVEFGLTQEQVAGVVGKSRSAIANTVRLLDLPDAVQSAVEAGSLTEGHARALLGIGKDEVAIARAAEHVVQANLTVRETEEYVREQSDPTDAVATTTKSTQPATLADPVADPNRTDVEERLQRALGTKIRIKMRKRGGVIQVGFHDADDLERLVARLDPPTSRFGELD